jgi:hypothetical protein
LKTELVYECNFATRAKATSAICEFIEVFYGRERCHSTLGYLTLAGYEALAN